MKITAAIISITLLACTHRFWGLEHNPPGFYSDEASYAYNAYSILKTGADEYGRGYPLVLEAFGDYKLPVMLYSIVGSFALFGVSDVTTRIPGAVYGLLCIAGMFVLTKKLYPETNNKDWIGIVSAAIITISPAHIFVSRGTWELTPALCFIIWGTILLQQVYETSVSQRRLQLKGTVMLSVAAIAFIAAIYSYNSARVFVPLYLIAFILIKWKQTKVIIQNNLKTCAAVCILGVILLTPIIKSIQSPEVLQRAKYISIFYDKGVEARLFDSIKSDVNRSSSVIETRVFHNKAIYYGEDFLRRYSSHFSPGFLFLYGDTFEIFMIHQLGFLPVIALPFLLVGAYKVSMRRSESDKLLAAWLFISPLASSLTIFTPSSSRAMNMIVPLAVFTAIGTIAIYEKIKGRYGIAVSILGQAIYTSLFIINSAFIFNRYFIQTPLITAEKWNDGYKELSEYVEKNEKKYDRIIISSSQAPSYIFTLWYLRYNPKDLSKNTQVNHTPDEHGLNFTSKVGKMTFTKNISQELATRNPDEKILYIGFANELTMYNKIIYSRNNKPVFEILE